MSLIKNTKIAILCALCVVLCLLRTDIPVHAEGMPKMEITLPKDGDSFFPGQTIQITVNADPGISNTLIVAAGLPRAKDTPNVNQFTLDIPASTPEGVYNMKAVSEYEGDYVESPYIKINVKWPPTPVEIKITPSPIVFYSLGDNIQLKVVGFFSDGTKLDITHDPKTAYIVDQPLIVTVSPDAVASSLSEGKTYISVQNGKLSRVVEAIAVSNYKRDNLYFDTGISYTPFKRTEDGGYSTDFIVSNESSIPLAAIGLAAVTLNGVEATNIPQPKKGFAMHEQWKFTLIFPKTVGEPKPLKNALPQNHLHVEGAFSVLPEGHYDLKQIKYDVNVDLPIVNVE